MTNKSKKLLAILVAVVILFFGAGSAKAASDVLHVGRLYNQGVSFLSGAIVNPQGPVIIGDDLRVDGSLFNGFGPLRINDNLIVYGYSEFRKALVNDKGPVTIGDDLDVHGVIQRKWGPVKINDDLQVRGKLDFPSNSISDAMVVNDITASNYLPLSGGTLTGNLAVNGVSGLTDSDIPDTVTASNYLPLTGGTLTGDLTMTGGEVLGATGNISMWTNDAGYKTQMPRYVDRDPLDYDFTIADFTCDGAWHELDLSEINPAVGANSLIDFEIDTDVESLTLRVNGHVNEINRWYLDEGYALAALYVTHYGNIRLDQDCKIQYKVPAGGGMKLNFVVRGWFE